MQNLIVGGLVIAVCFVIYYFSYRFWKEEKYIFSIGFILLAGFILRLFCSCDFYLHEWDERFHALVAKNLIDFPWSPMLYADPLLDYDYKDWSGNHVWVHKQPFPLYSMAMSMWIFGKSVIAMRMPSILISTSAILSTYKIGSLLYDKKVALIAAFLFSINGLIIEQTAGRVATDHFDVFFLSLISWAVYFILKYVDGNNKISLVASAIFTGLAILTKWLPALIVLPIWFVAAYNKRSFVSIITDMTLFTILVTCIAVPWQWYIILEFPLEASWEYGYNRKHIFEVLGSHGHSWIFHLGRMRIIFGELVYIPLIWFLVKIWSSSFSRKYLPLLIWIAIPYLFFSIAKTKMQGYILFTAPAIFIMVALSIDVFRSYEGKWKILVNALCILLLVLPIRYSIERVKPFSNRERSMPWIGKFQNLDNIESNEKKVIFNCKYPIQTMFFTSFIAYERIPSLGKLIDLNSKNVIIYLDDRTEIEEKYKDLDFINYISISSLE